MSINTKIAVVSDTHDNTTIIDKIILIANTRECAYLFHLGDITSPPTVERLSGFNGMIKAVYGNCDSDILGLLRSFNTIGGEIEKPPFKIEVEGKRIALMHEPFHLNELISTQEHDFIFYGHLHKADIRKERKTWILNPGGAGSSIKKPSFFIVDLNTNQMEQFDL